MKIPSRVLAIAAAAALGATTLVGCSTAQLEQANASFSEVDGIAELATLKCYYHNVSRAEKEADGLLSFAGVGYKKVWTEYDGVVEYGVDVGQLTVSEPDSDGTVQVHIPDAQILNVSIDEDSISDPVTETGFLTDITAKEKSEAFAAAQENMRETAEENEDMKRQATKRAKQLIEGYIVNVGKTIGADYDVEWV